MHVLKRLWLLPIVSIIFLLGCRPAEEPTEPAGGNQALIGEIRPLVEAFLNGGPTERAAQVAYITTACTTADGLGGPPKCDAGENDGTEVTAFPLSGAEGTFIRPENIDSALDFSVEGLYAVYQAPPSNDPIEYWPRGEYALLFDRTVAGNPSPIVALVENGKLVRLEYPFGRTAAEYLSSIGEDQILLAPEEAQALSAEIAGRGS